MSSNRLLIVAVLCCMCLVIGGIITAVLYWGNYACPTFGSDCPAPGTPATGAPTGSPASLPTVTPPPPSPTGTPVTRAPTGSPAQSTVGAPLPVAPPPPPPPPPRTPPPPPPPPPPPSCSIPGQTWIAGACNCPDYQNVVNGACKLPACQFTRQFKSGTTCSVACGNYGTRPAEWVLSPNQSHCDTTTPTDSAGNLGCFNICPTPPGACVKSYTNQCGERCGAGTSWGWGGNSVGWICSSDDAGG